VTTVLPPSGSRSSGGRAQWHGDECHITNSVTGNLFLPKTAEAFTFDQDGNQTSDGRWTNTWDGANRLIPWRPLPQR